MLTRHSTSWLAAVVAGFLLLASLLFGWLRSSGELW